MSLGARLVAGMVVVVVALGLAGWFTVTTMRGHLLDQVDGQLEGLARVGRIRGSLGQGAAVPLGAPPGTVRPIDEAAGADDADQRRPTPLWVGVAEQDGTVATVQRPVFDEVHPDPDTSQIAQVLADDAAATSAPFTVGSDPEGVRYRVRILPGEFAGGVGLIALPLDDVDAAAARLSVTVAAVTIGAALVLVFVIATVIRLGVLPLRRMTEAATVIAAGDLSHRVEHGQSTTEADQLGRSLNQMMTTIEEAFQAKDATQQRLRRFVADASHELRTPTSTVRGYAELYRLGGLAEPDAMADAMRRIEMEAARLGRLVEDLLLLARTDRARPPHRDAVDLSEVAAEVVEHAAVANRHRRVTLQTVADAVVVGDGDQLRQVVANLVDNAISHTPDDAAVQVDVTVEAGHVMVEVSDDGPGIPDHVGRQVFDRFWRADQSRTRASGGAGLGLSIVQAIVEAHDGDITLSSRPGHGATFAVRLPRLRDRATV